MLGREWNRKKIKLVKEFFIEVWIKKFYITIPLFFLVWSFKIPYMVYEMLFATILSFVYADRIIDKIKSKPSSSRKKYNNKKYTKTFPR
jgi:hypothetical protein